MPWFLYLFLSIFYLVGFGLLAGGIWGAYWSTAAESWSVAPGKILRAELKESGDSDGSTWAVEVEYTYTVGGVAYSGDRLAFAYAASSDQEAHLAVLKKLQGAKQVDVRYDPADPASSCLSYGIHNSIRILFVFAVTWLAFIFGFTLLMLLGHGEDTVLLENLVVK